tara:strand:- start:108 stop:707 length:600 start_codon:yes stop_codon:yes gene_type:complete
VPYKNKKDQYAAHKRYRQSLKGKIARKKAKTKYLETESGHLKLKQDQKKYSKSEKGKQRIKRWGQSEKGKKVSKRYAQSEKGKKKHKLHVKNYKKTYKGQLTSMWDSVRNRIKIWTFKNVGKRENMEDIIGCSRQFLREYLKRKFKPGMTWDNHGLWHIDHIVPLKKFDPNSIEDVKKANHYTNLQPLWASENIRKKDK